MMQFHKMWYYKTTVLKANDTKKHGLEKRGYEWSF